MRSEDKSSRSNDSGSSDQASSLRNVDRNGWILLAHIDLDSTHTAQTLDELLRKVLDPFHLHRDFVETVLISAQEAIAGHKPPGTRLEVKHIHLLVYVLKDYKSSERSWNFHRISKTEHGDGNDNRQYLIEFYLYQEDP
jgi:hypothetical protein